MISSEFKKPSQIIQPYYFGDEAQKTTCLWLKNLPLLIHYKEDTLYHEKTHVKPQTYITGTGKTYDKWWFETCMISDLKLRAEARSKTFPGIAKAMAEQWGNL